LALVLALVLAVVLAFAVELALRVVLPESLGIYDLPPIPSYSRRIVGQQAT
jgi:hypothetical protein